MGNLSCLLYTPICVYETGGEVLIRIQASGICGSDIPRVFQKGTYHFPTIPGHEFSGEIIDAFDIEDVYKRQSQVMING